MAYTDAGPVVIRNQAYRLTFAIYDDDGDPVAGATGLDSEVSLDGAAFADCVNESVEITGGGVYYLDLTADETDAETIAVRIQTTTATAKTTVLVLYTTTGTTITGTGGSELTNTTVLESFIGTHSYSAGQLANAVYWACSAIEEYCETTFAQTTYNEWQRGVGRQLMLKHRPLCAGVASIYRLARGTNGKLRLTAPAAGTNTKAQAVVTEDGHLLLHSSANLTTRADLTLSSYATMALLAAAINAGGVWTAEVLEQDAPAHLMPCTTGDINGTTYDLQGPGDLLECQSIDAQAGILSFGYSVETAFISYQAGYASIPYELQQIATQMAATILQHDSTVTSERIGNYSYTYASGNSGVLTPYFERLDKYRDRGLL